MRFVRRTCYIINDIPLDSTEDHVVAIPADKRRMLMDKQEGFSMIFKQNILLTNDITNFVSLVAPRARALSAYTTSHSSNATPGIRR
jgi:hypothetical protein